MSPTNNTVIKPEEETITLQRTNLIPFANRIRAARRRVKEPAVVIKVEDTPDNDNASPLAESDSSHGSRKRRRDTSEDEEEDQKPSKRRLSEQEVAQMEEEEIMQSLMEDCDEGESECEEPIRTLLEVKVEPVPEISVTLRNRHAATERSRARAPSPEVAGVHGVSVGGRLLRLTRERRSRLGPSPMEVPEVPTVAVAPRRKAPSTKRKTTKGRKRATK